MKPSATYEMLVDGVGPWDFTGGFVPCELLLVGEDAYPVLLSSKKQVLIAISQYGKGRMVVVSHEGILKDSKFFQFLTNAVEWLKPSPEALVGVHPHLDSLSQLLLRAGTKVHVGAELSPSLGVYCMEAYDCTQAKDLVGFLKGGGGLLVGGQAWHWARQHGKEKVLFEFPGNQVTSVAGVYFTGNAVEKGIFKVAKKIPKIPLVVPHQADLSRDAEFLLNGVLELDLVTGGIPSTLLVHGELCFPLCLDSSHRCLLAAGHYGRGRVVVASHESQLFSSKLSRFLLNAVCWLDAGRKGLVGVDTSLKKLCSLLSQGEVKSQVSQLTGDMSVYCCSSHGVKEAERVHAFVAEGGGLLIGGQAWYWASQNCGKAAVAQYPGNKVLNRFGLSILGQSTKAAKYLPVGPGEHYHFRKALALFSRYVDTHEEVQAPMKDWLQRLAQDCAAFLHIPAHDCPAYASLHRILTKVLQRSGIPQVSKHCPVKSKSKEAVLLCMATELALTMTDSAALVQKSATGVCALPITVEIDGTNPGKAAWRSTGLYAPEGHTAVISFPCRVVGAGLKVQIGCHTDDLSHATELKRAPVVIRTCDIASQNQTVSCLWGGLIYIVVPAKSNLGKVPITVEGAVRAPFFKLGETCEREWEACIRHYPAPWAELAVENLILTVPSDSICHMESPQPLLTLWNEIMVAISKLAAIPTKFPRPERIVTDVQISCGWMHAGYPIMGHLDSVKEMLDVKHMQTTGLWGPVHELGHNQQQQGWEFPPHTTEATCNLWSVYVHEKVLGIPRHQAHQALKSQCREERIREYLKKGAQLKDWNVWTALETYLQLQEGFGWDPFIHLFSDYQKMSTIPKDNPSKMNLWAQKFSQQVNKNLAPFFTAWGWPIKKELSVELSCLPSWEQDPMRSYNHEEKRCEHAYKCSSCSFSTMTISQLKEHSLKVHGKALTLPRPRIVNLAASHAHHTSKNHTPAEEVEDSNDSSYSEPPDVQQQLNHYQSAALARNNNNISPIPLSGSAAGLDKTEAILNCEFCEFSSGYIQSIRRHYRDKHGGKKLFKCKDCSFYTGFKSAFTMHVEAGHSAVPEEGPKDLRCPLCLYHTKYKRNMIDHIVLHREERVVPIEVCRSKLSKYLQGVVFRCDKCTFTCSSDESLQQHIEKHNELKPYKCQLCYYETKHTEELDAHLRDEHKVSRNFELVGRVNLDQLEQMKGKIESSSSDEEEKEEEELSPKTEERDPMMFPESGAPEKRFPCEFCGRSFTEGSEWERHVLRHGMALNENKHRTSEDSQPKEDIEETVNTLPEEKEGIEKMVVDYSHSSETAVSMVAADKPLQDNSEAKNE